MAASKVTVSIMLCLLFYGYMFRGLTREHYVSMSFDRKAVMLCNKPVVQRLQQVILSAFIYKLVYKDFSSIIVINPILDLF